MDEKKKVSYIKERLAQGPTAAELALWSEDPRMGVQHLLASYEKSRSKRERNSSGCSSSSPWNSSTGTGDWNMWPAVMKQDGVRWRVPW